MRSRTMPIVVLGLTAAASLTLTACGGDSGSDTASSTTSATPSSSASASASASTVPAPSSASSSSSDESAPTADNAAATSGNRCHTSDVTVEFATGDDASPSASDQTDTYVMITNKTKKTCTIKGFPGVDLKGGSTDWPLTRSGKTAAKIDAEPGVSVQFDITYLPWTKGSGTKFQPTSAVVTLPDETTSTTLKWPWGPVLLQDAATHPGTYVGPVGG